MHHYPASVLRLLRMFADPAMTMIFSVSGNLGKTDIGGNETSTNPSESGGQALPLTVAADGLSAEGSEVILRGRLDSAATRMNMAPKGGRVVKRGIRYRVLSSSYRQPDLASCGCATIKGGARRRRDSPCGFARPHLPPGVTCKGP